MVLLRVSESSIQRGRNTSAMSWEDVARLHNLAQVNMEIAIGWLDDCISYSQEAIEYLEKSGYLLKNSNDDVNSEAPPKRWKIPAPMQ
jgi:hypothetical protein